MAFDNPKDVRPCPRCEGTMTLARIIPEMSGLPEFRTYRCTDCGEVVTVAQEE
jgi:hypothetical protein